MKFYLGTHMVNWLEKPELADVPLFISINRLDRRVSLPKARMRWAMDSGGFSELKDHGRWRSTAVEYAARVRRYAEGIGNLDWVAPQDWMCEPWVVFGGVHGGQTFHGTQEARGINPGEPDDFAAAVRFHQQATVENFLELRRIAPDLPWIPVLQGWELADYERCAAMYEAAGVDLGVEPVIGLGSVCRRQATEEIARIVHTFEARGYRLHGFGVKTEGLGDYGDQLVSSDSMAWSFNARRNSRLASCTHRAKNCANCLDYALRWRQRALGRGPSWRQMTFDSAA